MADSWTISQKIAIGFALQTLLAVVIAVVGVYALQQVVAGQQQVLQVHARNLIATKELRADFEQKVSALRGYLLSANEASVEEAGAARRAYLDTLSRLRQGAVTDEGRRFVAEAERLEAEHQAGFERLVELRRAETPLAQIVQEFNDRVAPRRNDLLRLQLAYDQTEERQMQQGELQASRQAERTRLILAGVALGAVLAALVLAVYLGRTINGQIGAAVQHVQNSATELQSAASEQAAASTEQKAATTEASTTLRELVATSRQMADSSQRVTRIAEETAGTARSGDLTVQNAQDAINGIKRQVDQIVSHMLDLGKKSQQVGGVLELINELAEQTNILAINATIESAGAGENGKRFAVVAEEIRKLADRVAASTKEIRSLIEEIRASANTTVMATEDGAKAVDAGTRQFQDVTASFRQIAERVQTTTDASREIELGTRQQVTAVEQVSTALQGIVQAASQNETTTRQTVETASQLARLSQQLLQMIQPNPGNGGRQRWRAPARDALSASAAGANEASRE